MESMRILEGLDISGRKGGCFLKSGRGRVIPHANKLPNKRIIESLASSLGESIFKPIGICKTCEFGTLNLQQILII